MLKQAANDGLNCLIVVLVFNVIVIPADMWFHRPILGGLSEILIHSNHKLLTITVMIMEIFFGWLVFFLISLVGRWLNYYMGRNDIYKSK